MAAISQTLVSDAFSWIESFVFWLKFHWSLFLRVQLTINQQWFNNGLAPNRWQAIIWTNADPIHWGICGTGGWGGGIWVNKEKLKGPMKRSTEENSTSRNIKLTSDIYPTQLRRIHPKSTQTSTKSNCIGLKLSQNPLVWFWNACELINLRKTHIAFH